MKPKEKMQGGSVSPDPKPGPGFEEREEFYRTLISASPDAIVVTDLAGLVVFASPSAIKVFGCAGQNDLVGRGLLNWVAPKDHVNAHANLRHIVAEGGSRQTEFGLVKKDGNRFPAELNAALVRSVEGIPEGIIFVVRDITERKRIESALAEEAVRRRNLIEQSKDGIVLLDLEGTVHESNVSFARMLGYTDQEMMRLHVWDWDAQWTRQEVLLKLRDFEKESATFETRHRRKDGSVYDVEVSASRAQCGGQVLIYCVSRDISDRKAAERVLSERQAKLDGILRTAPIGIAFVINRVMIEVNATFCSMIGFTREELIGKSSRQFYPTQDDYDRFGKEIYGQLGECHIRTVEINWRHKGGEVIQVLASASPIDRNDLSQGVVFTAMDITARKRSEAELEKVHKELVASSRQAGMAEVATSVLHNVGNVLNSINVAANVVCDRVKKSRVTNVTRLAALMSEHAADIGAFITSDPNGRQLPGYLGQLGGLLAQEQSSILKELDSLKKNIEHVKDIVAVQQSYAKVSGLVETLKVTDVVEDALRMNAAALNRHELQVFREYEPDLPEIATEKHKVLQILVNLIRNAKHACADAGSPGKRLTLRVRNGGDFIKIDVADNGIGIPVENLTRIFNHGFTTRKEGHGFGLHSGALNAKELGGSLHVQSGGVGKGATFTLELPCKRKGQSA